MLAEPWYQSPVGYNLDEISQSDTTRVRGELENGHENSEKSFLTL